MILSYAFRAADPGRAGKTLYPMGAAWTWGRPLKGVSSEKTPLPLKKHVFFSLAQMVQMCVHLP